MVSGSSTVFVINQIASHPTIYLTRLIPVHGINNEVPPPIFHISLSGCVYECAETEQEKM